MKNWMLVYFLVLNCIGFSSWSNVQARYEQEARVWASQVMQEVKSDEEITLIMNLLYFSAQRSVDILVLQKRMTDYMQNIGPLMHDVIIARRNPARLSSIMNYTTEAWNSTFDHALQASVCLLAFLPLYRSTAATYAHCLEHLIKDDGIRAELLSLINQLRDNGRDARMVVLREHVTSISTIKEDLEKIMKSCSGVRELLEEDFSEKLMRGIMQTISSFSESAAVASYVKLDRKYMQFNDALWHTLTAGHEVYGLLWEMLETARAEFYQAHYSALQRALCDHEEYVIAYDAHGLIAPENRVNSLPPHVLMV